jgi:hypothetical protein
VNVTEVPEHMLLELAAIETDGTTTGHAVICILSIVTYAELELRVNASTFICIELVHDSVLEVKVPDAVL